MKPISWLLITTTDQQKPYRYPSFTKAVSFSVAISKPLNAAPYLHRAHEPFPLRQKRLSLVNAERSTRGSPCALVSLLDQLPGLWSENETAYAHACKISSYPMDSSLAVLSHPGVYTFSKVSPD